MIDKKQLSLRRKQLRQDNQLYGDDFVTIPKEHWKPATWDKGKRIAVYRSRGYLVQVFEEGPGFRMTVNRSDINSEGNWIDGITWDQLFEIKNKIFPDLDAVEIYPRESDLINVGNLRHLWVFTERIPFAWRKNASPSP